MNGLDRLERKMGRFYLPQLMKYLCLAMLGVFILDYLPLPRSASNLLYFSRSLILQGQIWRIVTYMAVPVGSGMIGMLLRLYFYYFLGTALENRWGSRKFNLYILIGWLSGVLCGFLTGYATNAFLYTTLLLAFAMLYPEMEVMLFFLLPVKVKWLGWLAAAEMAYEFIVSSGMGKLSLLFALAPFLLFFGKDCYLQLKLWLRRLRYWLSTRK